MNYLITGGTGLLGKQLSKLLLANGHKVAILTRSKREDSQVKYYQWDIKKGEIEAEALEKVDCLIHLAGAGIADEKWTDERKKAIIDSRVQPLTLLAQKFKEAGVFPKSIVSASAVGIYGFDTGDKNLAEDDDKGKDYISEVVIKWEKAVDDFAALTKSRAVKLRIGIVLDKNGGALPQLALPVKLGVGSALGDGEQWLSWIHTKDLCQLFYQCSLDEGKRGAYNAVAPNPVTNKEMVKVLGKVLHRAIWAPKVPAFVLKLILGERAQLVLGGNKVSASKIEATGFNFKFSILEDALTEIYKS
ncbi:TIGR01777 family oxidoreductase [Arcticibacterium luteifluviistationis]|uniref:TIGR01777 family protein n=1 Tax=Arcticibacterium luteifluviistationis TaxID=1784714 RepID=A0A2Z4GD14_9BACT|nr:TIGR01777 family oxidoreductase [Arcticibacterium luteifluviistationis]AWV99189.1 TIGR01777 family protein [Arcticibacterium luteifluviistationis]